MTTLLLGRISMDQMSFGNGEYAAKKKVRREIVSMRNCSRLRRLQGGFARLMFTTRAAWRITS